MKLKALISKEEYDKLVDSLKELYVEADGEYTLDLDENPLKTKLDEFRSNNRRLHAEKKALEDTAVKFKDIDPVKYQKALQALEELDKNEELRLIKEGKLDEVVQKRTETMRLDYEKRFKEMSGNIENLTSTATQYKNRLADLLVESNVTKAVSAVGVVRQNALNDVINRARQNWTVGEDGNLVPKDLYNDKGVAMSMDEWAQRLVKEAPYFFESAQGSGANGGKKGGVQPGPKEISNDPLEFGKNLENIAAGRVTVRPQVGLAD